VIWQALQVLRDFVSRISISVSCHDQVMYYEYVRYDVPAMHHAQAMYHD
jgi:hypothetical protein